MRLRDPGRGPRRWEGDRMIKATPAQRKAVRARIMTGDGVFQVRIYKNGDVHSHGYMPRADGGRTPWRRFEGKVDELAGRLDRG